MVVVSDRRIVTPAEIDAAVRALRSAGEREGNTVGEILFGLSVSVSA